MPDKSGNYGIERARPDKSGNYRIWRAVHDNCKFWLIARFQMNETLDVRKIRIYIGAVFVLFFILTALFYLYYMLNRPPQPLKKASPKGFEHLFSIYGFGSERFNHPSDVAVAGNGDIYVADTDNHQIAVFDEAGKFLRKHRDFGKGKGQFEYPSSIDVAGNGNIYLAVKSLNKLMILSSNFKLLKEIEVEKPIEVSVHKNRVYVGTYRGIIVADLDGNLLYGFGKRGKAQGEFDFPRGIAVDEKNNIYVADSLNYRIQALNSKGKPIWVLGKPFKDIVAAKRRFSLPVSLVVADDGYLYLMDAFAAEIYALDDEGNQVARYGDWGHDEGFFYYPGGISYMGDEKFAIADTFNDRVQVVRIPSPAVSLLRRVTRPNWYWLLLLPVLPFALLLWRRRPEEFYLANEDFLAEAVLEGKVKILAEKYKRIWVTENVYQKFRDVDQRGIKLEELLKIKDYDDRLVEQFKEDYRLADEEATLLSGAVKGSKRVMIFAENNQLRDAAGDMGIPNMNYSEFSEINGEVPAEKATRAKQESSQGGRFEKKQVL